MASLTPRAAALQRIHAAQPDWAAHVAALERQHEHDNRAARKAALEVSSTCDCYKEVDTGGWVMCWGHANGLIP